ncbi:MULTISPECIES: NUDIX hydrolase [Aerococcus]|uniref:NUDIX hydrolase n=1 Tax=Aerococcus TaxID=1375 RepID=UPI000200F07E|nr:MULTISPECIES: CoA pyrophosphatase [Aerococcus]AEA01495.1 hydrolase, NUDIX family [Aerococcus sp. Group 1]MCY3030690.1 CoA pyrophosphatase [Aerococcus sp. Group 1]MCY3054321.1 CoA pyrophosphatase [Aerococcus sp. Group 1]MCY3056051.1 CoA pyrophosphatase [Aerococcus sp. Group 1]MCY3062021.1 CoA pyrophosphatase [Aerococcus sp. Group 1]
MLKDYQAFFRDYEGQPLGVERFYAVLIPIVSLKGQGPALLYEHRAPGISQAGDAAFPGGRVEAGESFAQAAVRETQEELGLGRDKIQVLGEMDYIVQTKRVIAAYVAYLTIDHLDDLALNHDEVKHVFTVPLADLDLDQPEIYRMESKLDRGHHFPYDRIPGGKSYRFKNYVEEIPFYNIDQENLWGLTAQLTQRFVQLTAHLRKGASDG